MQTAGNQRHGEPRNTGLRRLKLATRAAAAGTAILAGVFAGLAAASSPGRKDTQPPPQPRPVRRVEPATAALEVSTPVPLPAPSSAAPAPAPTPAPSAQPPVESYSQPVVASGGS